jgi:hypothetical protein
MGEGARQGLHLTDGDWNKGGDPLPAAARFDKPSVIGIPLANDQKIRHLALRGKGTCAIVTDETEIAGIMMLIRRGESCIRPDIRPGSHDPSGDHAAGDHKDRPYRTILRFLPTDARSSGSCPQPLGF